MFMLKCAANCYRLASEAHKEGAQDSVVQHYLTEARYYDSRAIEGK